MEKVIKREGLICVCAECDKIIKFLGVIEDRQNALVSHGICPECANRLYGDLFSK